MGKLIYEEAYSKPDFYSTEGGPVPCRSNPDAFWLEDENGEGLRGATRRAAVLVAKSYCAECPVRIECLRFARRTGQRGVWGGTTDEERSSLIRKSTSAPRRTQAA